MLCSFHVDALSPVPAAVVSAAHCHAQELNHRLRADLKEALNEHAVQEIRKKDVDAQRALLSRLTAVVAHQNQMLARAGLA